MTEREEQARQRLIDEAEWAEKKVLDIGNLLRDDIHANLSKEEVESYIKECETLSLWANILNKRIWASVFYKQF